MGRQLNEGIEDGRRAWAITTIGLFTLVTSSGLMEHALWLHVWRYEAGLCLAGILYRISGLGITVEFQLSGAGPAAGIKV